MTIFIFVLVGAVAFGLSYWFTSKFTPFTIQDTPNSRSLHEYPTPRAGGVAIIVAIIVGWACLICLGYWTKVAIWILPSVLLVAFVSFLDDWIGLSLLFRLIIHGLTAVLLISVGLYLPWGVIGVLLTWFAIVWLLNLYNFMDGMDGFAAGMGLIGFGFLGFAGWMGGSWEFALYSWVIAIASGGFLFFNFPPARIFMGDIGSIPLGLLAAALSLWGIRDGLFPVWLPVLVFSPFVVDATVTLLLRLFRGEKIWQAHRSHYYQRLVLAGWSHRRTVLAEYLLMISSGFLALVAMDKAEIFQWYLLGGWSILYVILTVGVKSLEKANV